MPLITVHADLKATVAALNRIAHVLERIAVKYMGLELEDSPEPIAKNAVEEVAYTSDRQEVRKEISEKLGIPMEAEEQESDVLPESH